MNETEGEGVKFPDILTLALKTICRSSCHLILLQHQFAAALVVLEGHSMNWLAEMNHILKHLSPQKTKQNDNKKKLCVFNSEIFCGASNSCSG